MSDHLIRLTCCLSQPSSSRTWRALLSFSFSHFCFFSLSLETTTVMATNCNSSIAATNSKNTRCYANTNKIVNTGADAHRLQFQLQQIQRKLNETNESDDGSSQGVKFIQPINSIVLLYVCAVPIRFVAVVVVVVYKLNAHRFATPI